MNKVEDIEHKVQAILKENDQLLSENSSTCFGICTSPPEKKLRDKAENELKVVNELIRHKQEHIENVLLAALQQAPPELFVEVSINCFGKLRYGKC